MRHLLKRILTHHEGFEGQPYDDGTGGVIKAPEGNVTIGIGRNTDARPLTLDEGLFLLDNDINILEVQVVERLPWAVEKLSLPRLFVILDMAYNLGIDGLLKFQRFLAACEREEWAEAGAEMEDSLWWHQVGRRAKTLQAMMVNGTFPDWIYN